METDFDIEFKAIEKELTNSDVMVLATSAENRVTARSMSTIYDSGFIYLQTDRKMLKYKQIEENCNVALSVGFLQLEGKAVDIGGWNNNSHLLELYKAKHNSSYEKYKNLKSETVIRIEINYIKKWRYVSGVPFELIIKPLEKSLIQEEYICQ